MKKLRSKWGIPRKVGLTLEYKRSPVNPEPPPLTLDWEADPHNPWILHYKPKCKCPGQLPSSFHSICCESNESLAGAFCVMPGSPYATQKVDSSICQHCPLLPANLQDTSIAADQHSSMYPAIIEPFPLQPE